MSLDKKVLRSVIRDLVTSSDKRDWHTDAFYHLVLTKAGEEATTVEGKKAYATGSRKPPKGEMRPSYSNEVQKDAIIQAWYWVKDQLEDEDFKEVLTYQAAGTDAGFRVGLPKVKSTGTNNTIPDTLDEKASQLVRWTRSQASSFNDDHTVSEEGARLVKSLVAAAYLRGSEGLLDSAIAEAKNYARSVTLTDDQQIDALVPNEPKRGDNIAMVKQHIVTRKGALKAELESLKAKREAQDAPVKERIIERDGDGQQPLVPTNQNKPGQTQGKKKLESSSEPTNPRRRKVPGVSLFLRTELPTRTLSRRPANEQPRAFSANLGAMSGDDAKAPYRSPGKQPPKHRLFRQ